MLTSKAAAKTEKIDENRTRYYYLNKDDSKELRDIPGFFAVVVKEEPGLYVIDLYKQPFLWWTI